MTQRVPRYYISTHNLFDLGFSLCVVEYMAFIGPFNRVCVTILSLLALLWSLKWLIVHKMYVMVPLNLCIMSLCTQVINNGETMLTDYFLGRMYLSVTLYQLLRHYK